MHFPRVSTLKTAAEFRDRLQTLAIDLPFDEQVITGPDSPLAQPYLRGTGRIGNRFCILPMEGWDGSEDGRPSDLTRRRWRNFGRSGAKLIWGGEAVAVRPDGRANPNQLLLNESTLRDLADLRLLLETTHREHFGNTDDLLVGLQLTHSGRFARPFEKHRPEPRVVYRHPLLDARCGVGDGAVLSDDEIARLTDDFIQAARLAQRAGFAFVDVKHCHGYLGHEFLSAVDRRVWQNFLAPIRPWKSGYPLFSGSGRSPHGGSCRAADVLVCGSITYSCQENLPHPDRPGQYGGNLDNRTRFLRDIVAGIRAEAPGLDIGVRVSVFDFVPFQPGPDGTGIPVAAPEPYRYAFGGDGTGLGIELAEPSAFLNLLERLQIDLVCSTAGSPYYNPHMQRPAAFPPSDGYQPPEDPLVGVARQIAATAQLKCRHPRLTMVGSGYSYLQEWLPNVGQRVLRNRGADFIGLGRMVLSYAELPADVLAGRPLARKRICRTFSECTTAPRNGLVSGCYPLDPYYKDRPERQQLLEIAKTGSQP